MKFEVTSTKRFELIVSYLGGMSVLLITYNIFITIRFNKDLEQNRLSYNTLSNIQTNYLLPQQELLSNYPEGYFLYASMNQDTDLGTTEPTQYDPIKRKQVETYCALRIFQSVEDFLSIDHCNAAGLYVWINNFLMWMQSPLLQNHWKVLESNYAQDTRELVERLIDKALELSELRKQKGNLTADDYDTVSKNFKTNLLSSRFMDPS
jgi:hypothetical protein